MIKLAHRRSLVGGIILFKQSQKVVCEQQLSLKLGGFGEFS